MARTPQQIFEHHAGALIAGDIDETVADHPDDAVLITPRGAEHGKDGVREAFTELAADLPDAKWGVPTQTVRYTVERTP
jgi:ketosteroid isomerase-like protein